MLGVNQIDFLNYKTAFKGNYRKGVHVMRSILSTPLHAEEFAKNKGGVAVVLGIPIDAPDKNSDELLALLLGSSVADTAMETFMGLFYEFTDLDDLFGDATRCAEIVDTPLLWRVVSASNVGMGKLSATLAGLSCSAYADMTAVAASSVAMAAVAASSVAMTAVTASPTAMAAICASSMAVAKYATSAAGLNPADYADMTAVAASSVAMAAVIASPTALNAVVSSSVAMAAVAASSVAMTAVAASSTARSAVEGSTTAKTALAASPLKTTVTKGGSNDWETRTVRSGKGWVISCYNANSGGEAGSTWYNLDGTQTTQPAGTTNVGKFFLTSFSIYWWSSTSSVTYIPIT